MRIQKLNCHCFFAGLAPECRPDRHLDPQGKVRWQRGQRRRWQTQEAKEAGGKSQDFHLCCQVKIHPGQVVPGGKDVEERQPFDQAEVPVVKCRHSTSERIRRLSLLLERRVQESLQV